MLTKILIKHHKGIDSELEEKAKSFSTAAATNITSKFATTVPNIGDKIKEILRAIQKDADRAIITRTQNKRKRGNQQQSNTPKQKNFQRVPCYRGPKHNRRPQRRN